MAVESWPGWLDRCMELDLTADAVTLTDAAGQHRVGQPERAGDRGRGRAGAARAAAPLTVDRGRPHRRRPHRPGRGERVVIAGHLDTVPVNDNLPRPPRRRPAARSGHVRHEGRRRRTPAAGRDRPRAGPRRHLHPLRRPRRSTREFNGLRHPRREPDPDLMAADFAILMEPSNAVGRGGLPGHPAGRGPYHGRARPLRPQLARRQRHPRCRRGAGAGSNAYDARRRRSSTGWSTTRASTPCSDPRRRRRQRDPRRVRGRGELPAAPPTAPRPSAEAFVREFFEGYDVTPHRLRPRGPARASTGPPRRRSSRRSAAR